MNRKSLIICLSIAAAAASPESYTEHNTPFVSTTSRSAVHAELATRRQSASPWSTSYNPLANIAATAVEPRCSPSTSSSANTYHYEAAKKGERLNQLDYIFLSEPIAKAISDSGIDRRAFSTSPPSPRRKARQTKQGSRKSRAGTFRPQTTGRCGWSSIFSFGPGACPARGAWPIS
jgi:hypothetical protein